MGLVHTVLAVPDDSPSTSGAAASSSQEEAMDVVAPHAEAGPNDDSEDDTDAIVADSDGESD